MAIGPRAEAQNSVYSANIVGIQKVQVATNLTLQGNPFESDAIRGVVGNAGQYTTLSDPAAADNVLFYDPLTYSYQTYYLRSHSSIGHPEWRIGSTWATNVPIAPGQGFFYRSRTLTTRTNMLVGDVVLAKAVTNTIQPGLNLLAYPFSAPVKMSDMNLKNGQYTTSSDAQLADNIMLYDSGSQSYQTYYLRSHSSIGRPEWRIGSVWATNVTINSGVGFWFRSRLGSPYYWVENTPYPSL